MTPTLIANHFVDLDPEGYLTDAVQWDETIAQDIAAANGIPILSERHWVVIRFMRDWYITTGSPPSLRTIGRESGVPVRELYALFPRGPAKLAAKIGGIPKPHICI